ncbi:hypothetical protein COHA_002643 [Chlorella ohadii]|uniref:Uncharacterized protein n=1 Tax=Chlorella ohadii TaxID=2649997 RepID=A0AAD5DTI4_9CHLO|nr:hypothetical protein COHA_002643 [Chlorella ohadii]
MSKAATVQALLAAGATYPLPALRSESWGDLFADRAASPWFWADKWSGHSGNEGEAADATAVRASLLRHVLQHAAAGTGPEIGPEQLMALLVAAGLEPACTDQLAAVAALPGAADKLDTAQRRRLARLVVKCGEAAAVQALQAGPLRQQPIDPHGSLLQDIANNRRSDALPMARALLQHGTSITLTAINNVVNERTNAPLLELILSSGLPLPKVPRGSKKRSVAMWDGEYGSPEDFHNVCCPFYTLFRRDCHYLMKTPQELRVRMCQALLRAGYRPTVYRSIQLQVLSKREDCYEPRCLPNFHILRDWGRKGFAKKSGAERICCFPGAEPQQDKLLTGDNRLLWMLVEGEPWSPADHRYWPPAFKAAASLLSHLPHGLVLAVIAAAAFPLDAWFDEASKKDWLASEFYTEMNLRF